MKIAMYVPEWPPGSSANGIVTYASYMVPALRKLGHEVFVITLSAKADDDQHLIDLTKYDQPLPLWNKLLFKISPTDAHYHAASAPLVRAIRELVASRGVEIFEMEESFGLSHAISKLGLIPVCVRLHGPWFLNKRFKDRRRERLERRAIQSADFVTSPSQKILDNVVAYYGLKLTRTSALPNSIMVPPSQWGQSQSQNILFVGRFDEIKGGDLAIKAFGILASRYPRLRLTFVGHDQGIGGLKLLDFARKGLTREHFERLNYLGELSQDSIAALRLNQFVTIVPSRHEVLPYSVLEAMAFGCPVVASAVGGIPELIKDGTNGILFESGNAEDLVTKLRSLLDNQNLAAKIGASARFYAGLYKPEQMAIYAAEYYRQAASFPAPDFYYP